MIIYIYIYFFLLLKEIIASTISFGKELGRNIITSGWQAQVFER